MRNKFTAVLLMLVSIVSCKESSNFAGQAKKEKKETPPKEQPAVVEKTKERFTLTPKGKAKIDIAFFFDTSLSMKEEINAIETRMQSFIDKVTDDDSQIDYQVFVVAQSSKVNIALRDSDRLDIRNSEVNSHSGLWNAYHFLEKNADKVPSGHLVLRQDATKELVFLTDDDAKDITSANFGPYLKENRDKLGQVHVNGFVGLSSSRTTSTCKVTQVGRSYQQLANDDKFSGFIADVCSDKWDEMLSDFASSVKSRTASSGLFKLKKAPTNKSSIIVEVDGKAVDTFEYVQASQSIKVNLKPSDKSRSIIVTYK